MTKCSETGVPIFPAFDFDLLVRLATGTVFGLFLLVPVAACSQQAPNATENLSVCGASVDVRFDGTTENASRADLLRWVQRAGSAVCTYYGKFPLPKLLLDIHARGGPGVHHGVTYPHGDGGFITISVGAQTTPKQLDEDWMLTHEMIHLAFPSMADNHHWIEEGISVYVEPIARVQAGQLDVGQMWSDVVRDMPKGEPEAGDEGLDRTHTWGRTYWGGAMFCLEADVRIRQQTHNRRGLQDALRGILDAGGNITQDWKIEKAFAAGDAATGTTVLQDLYREMRDHSAPVDLPAVWKQLGIDRKTDGTVEFVSTAPLASVREAITRRTSNGVNPSK